MRQIVVYVPAISAQERLHIARGSGIVGVPDAATQTVLIYFEGAVHVPPSISTFTDRVMQAYYRMSERAPSISKDRVRLDSVIAVGTLDPHRKLVTLTGPQSEKDLARWLGVAVLDPRQLYANHHR